MRKLALALAALALASCGGGGERESTPPTNTVNERCAQLAQEVTDAYNRGDTEAERAAADAFDRDCAK